MISTLIVSVLLLASLLWERHQHAHALTRLEQAHGERYSELLAANDRERDRWADERQSLLQRIQAPEQAVIDHSIAQVPQVLHMPPVLAMDDDDAHRISKDELAEHEWAAEVAG
jgi:hypothetical protein